MLSQRILTELSQLDMPRVQFSCRFQELELTPNGADGVAFLYVGQRRRSAEAHEQGGLRR